MSIAPARLKNINAPDVIKGPSDAPSPVLCGPPRRRWGCRNVPVTAHGLGTPAAHTAPLGKGTSGTGVAWHVMTSHKEQRPAVAFASACVYRKLKHARSDGEARRGSYMT